MALDLRPLTTAELLDRTFFLYRKHFTLFVGIAVIPMLVNLLANLAQISILSSYSISASQFEQIMTTALAGLGLVVIQLLASLFVQGATIAAVSDVYLERPSGIGQSFARLRGNFLRILCAVIFMCIVIGFGFIFFIIPGIILAVAFILTIPVVVIENQPPVDAMTRSWRLTKEGRWRIFMVVIIVSILGYIVSSIFQAPGLIMAGISIFRDPSNVSVMSRIVTQIGSFFALCLVTPLYMIALSLLYYDQRVRKEGFDLQLMVSSLELKTDEAPRPEIF